MKKIKVARKTRVAGPVKYDRFLMAFMDWLVNKKGFWIATEWPVDIRIVRRSTMKDLVGEYIEGLNEKDSGDV